MPSSGTYSFAVSFCLNFYFCLFCFKQFAVYFFILETLNFGLCCVLMAARGLSLIAGSERYSLVVVWVSHCGGFSRGAQALSTWALALATRGSVVEAHGL